MKPQYPHVLFAAAGLAASLAGCMSASTPPNAATPWTPPSGAQKPDVVWKVVRARPVDFSAPFALADLADMALQNNPATRKAWNEARAAAARMEQAKGYFMPTLTGTASAQRLRTIAEPDTFNQNYTKYGPGLQASWLLFNFGGGRKAAVEQALQTVYAADFAFNRSFQDVLLAVETAYYGLVSAQAGSEAAEISVQDAEATLEAAQDRKDAGLGTRLDVLQAQTGYDQALFAQAGAEGQFLIARGALAQAVGLPADTPLNVEPPVSDVPPVLPAQDLRTLIDDALERRPDIASLRATLASAKAGVKVTGSTLWPSLFLNGAASRSEYDSMSDTSDTTGRGLQDNDWTYSAGLSLQWTLFDGFQTMNTRRAALAQVAALQSRLEEAELAVGADVWTRHHLYETALRKHTFSAAFFESAQAAYDLSMDSYKAGLVSILELLNAESQLAQARQQWVTARQDAFTALTRLAHALGRLEASGADRTADLTSTPKEQQP